MQNGSLFRPFAVSCCCLIRSRRQKKKRQKSPVFSLIFHRVQCSLYLQHCFHVIPCVWHLIFAPLTAEGAMFGLLTLQLLYIASLERVRAHRLFPTTTFHNDYASLPISPQFLFNWVRIILLFLLAKIRFRHWRIRDKYRPHNKHLRASFSEIDASLF